MQTTQTLIGQLALSNPGKRFAHDAKTDSLIAYYDETKAEFLPCISRTITGDWSMLPYEILANGRRMIEITPGNTWVEYGQR